MGIEIERKFLVVGDAWRKQVANSQRMVQGYIAGPGVGQQIRCSIRIRIVDDKAFLNIKSVARSIERQEFEYTIPLVDGEQMLALMADKYIEKIRHCVNVEDYTFEIDEFLGENSGLIVAELELPAADACFPQPSWLGAEVSHLSRYYNVSLVAHPYAQWPITEQGANDLC